MNLHLDFIQQVQEFNTNSDYTLDAESANYQFPMWLVDSDGQQITSVDSFEEAEAIVAEYEHPEPIASTRQLMKADEAIALLDHWIMAPDYPKKEHWIGLQLAIAVVENIAEDEMQDYDDYDLIDLVADSKRVLAIAQQHYAND